MNKEAADWIADAAKIAQRATEQGVLVLMRYDIEEYHDDIVVTNAKDAATVAALGQAASGEYVSHVEAE